MARLASITNGLTRVSLDPVRDTSLETFTAANISGNATREQLANRTDYQYLINIYNTWTFSNGNVGLISAGLPYHSYYDNESAYLPSLQSYSNSWTYRGGLNQASSTPRGTGIIGFWLNGIPIYSPGTLTVIPVGFQIWSNWTYIAAAGTASELEYEMHHDLAGGFASSPNRYQYRDFSFAMAWQTGRGWISGDFGQYGMPECSVIPYLRYGLRHQNGHSKILGISADGYPIYGPYGYSSQLNASSPVRRLVSGYTRNGTRPSVLGELPDIQTHPLGMFVQDYTYTLAGDLDQNNGRFCLTPEYPSGTYAYFCTIDAALRPCYPYVIGNTFYGAAALLQ